MAHPRNAPPAGADAERAAFLRDLRALRDQAGLGPRDLAARAHFPEDTLKTAESGPALPSLPVLEAYVRGCGAGPAEWEDRWRRLTQEAVSRAALPTRAPSAERPPARAMPFPDAVSGPPGASAAEEAAIGFGLARVVRGLDPVASGAHTTPEPDAAPELNGTAPEPNGAGSNGTGSNGAGSNSAGWNGAGSNGAGWNGSAAGSNGGTTEWNGATAGSNATDSEGDSWFNGSAGAGPNGTATGTANGTAAGSDSSAARSLFTPGPKRPAGPPPAMREPFTPEPPVTPEPFAPEPPAMPEPYVPEPPAMPYPAAETPTGYPAPEPGPAMPYAAAPGSEMAPRYAAPEPARPPRAAAPEPGLAPSAAVPDPLASAPLPPKTSAPKTSGPKAHAAPMSRGARARRQTAMVAGAAVILALIVAGVLWLMLG